MNEETTISNAVYCRGCGNTVHPEAPNCPKCGAPQKLSKQRTRTTAMILAFFLGGFGAHRFYLGQKFWGIMYLLLFWTFIPAILALIEFFGFLMMTDERFDKLYN